MFKSKICPISISEHHVGLLSAAFSNVLVGRMMIDTIDTVFRNRATSSSFDLARITFIVPVAVPAVMSYALNNDLQK